MIERWAFERSFTYAPRMRFGGSLFFALLVLSLASCKDQSAAPLDAAVDPKPVIECGGAAGATCPAHFTCVHSNGGSDLGVCVASKQGELGGACGGMGMLPCSPGLRCIASPQPDAMGSCVR
ncbi:hypothetical protein BH09MYX1_BH09MYX1_16110 [soil metagenome]